VVRLDRLARSVSHLLDVIERLEAKGAHFRSLRDPIDTTTPQGVNGARIFPRSGGVKFPTSFTDRLDLAGRLRLPT
ncbi:MAG TPA: recombinase family protein, partial [Solirubrobacteraceae bacterium]|nr:recombinase family protein [Solirubrobacteraceae bacterium]